MKKIIFAVMALTVFGTGLTNAQENNSVDFKKWQVRVRGVGVVPDESAKIGIIGGDAKISNTFIPELDFTYFFTKNISAELILGTSKHDVSTVGSDISAVGGPTSADVNLGSVYLLPPTLTVQYHFLPDQIFNPYVGAGVNYTIFYNEKAGNTVRGIEYDNSFGYAFQVGFDLMLNDKFFINADIKKIFLKTDVTVDASNLATGLSIPADVEINPLLLGFGVGMKF
ncbi:MULTISPECIES: OmpW family protein [Flavobacterium]|jgi:outer membrane protein|uniref:OmpW/AlkL family protein n=1 Tax=Flavobacterium TaxID=237 RepID=UPI0006F409B1|nr:MULTISPECIES: OmpW family outer membrane protein [Flavobacterium]KQS53357.1 OmpW family protein [Flavobacterium sp. Leaf359]MDQ7961430.1 OmpW family outer membrane protein [Flavobacterium lindanitolerans]PZO32915.1 MAG: OmpW family protein [Flavobacteriaceae bacterium]THD31962.1 MAG: OmpW family protein [Flavobacterium johnsoniae]